MSMPVAPEPSPHDPIQIDTSEILAVVDTNVLLDIYSCHDLVNTYELLGEHGVDDAQAVYRRARARESLLLALHFHEVSAVTYSLRAEAVIQLTTQADPAADDTMQTQHTMKVADFVVPTVLPDWRALGPLPGALELRATEADRHLVEYAREHNLPLITNEGFTPTGTTAQGMRKRALVAGVRVFTPREFYAGKIVEDAAIEGFLARFEGSAAEYIQARANPDLEREALIRTHAYLRHVLLGETDGRATPVRVTVP